MITFDNVTKIYNDNVGLENASIQINDGEFVFLVGPSGAGKSTFIKLILKATPIPPKSLTAFLPLNITLRPKSGITHLPFYIGSQYGNRQ